MSGINSSLPSGSQKTLFGALLGRFPQQWQSLADKPDETPEAVLRTLWFAAAGAPRSVAHAQQADPLPQLSEGQVEALEGLIVRRLAAVPLAHLCGLQRFMELEFLSSADALIPRKETELLGYAALRLLQERVREQGRALVIDLCTGSGNLAVSLAHHEANCEVHAVDICAPAVALAQRNVERHRLEGRVFVYEGDLFGPLDCPRFHGQVDMIVCNPPYISSAKVNKMQAEIAGFEPREAFDGGPFGLNMFKRLFAEVPSYLKPASWLCFEIGAGQGNYLMRALADKPVFASVESVQDASGVVRAIVAKSC